MTKDEVVEALEPWRARHRRPAWDPVVEEGDGPRDVPKFGGVPWTGPDDPWPACQICGKPLPLLVQLDLDRLPSGRFGSGLLQLFYCTRGDCDCEGGWEPFNDKVSRVRVVQPAGPGLEPTAEQLEALLPAKRIIRWDEFVDEPGSGEHEDLGLSYGYDLTAQAVTISCPVAGLTGAVVDDAEMAEVIAETQAGDKLAGWPCWVQNVEYPACPRCGKRMEMILQVDSEDNVPFMFGDNGCGHVTQCPDHKDVVAFGWACC
jgi:hypothetical protein